MLTFKYYAGILLKQQRILPRHTELEALWIMLDFEPGVYFLVLTTKLVIDLLDFSAYLLYSIDTGFPFAQQ
jgi:hypothetical protein